MDGLKMMTVLGSFQGSGGGNGSGGPDFSHGGTMEGNLKVTGDITATVGSFDEIIVAGSPFSAGPVLGPQCWQRLDDVDAIRDG